MSNVQIPNLPASTTLTGSEQLEIVQAGVSVRTTTGAVAGLTNYGGTVTSIATSLPITGGTITTTGTIALQSASIDNTYLAPMPALTIKGNRLGSSQQPQDLTAAQVFTLIGAAPINSPAFTGTPTAPTPVITDNSTQIATTAFVKALNYGQGTVTSVATGTGLTGGPITSTGTISIANTGVAASTYGSATNVPTIAINAQGQITSALNTAIQISPSQVTGLGTMATQNANSVAITGGAINGTTIGGTTPAAGSFTALTATGTTNLGTIASGVWNGTAIDIPYGGTNATTAAGARANLGAAKSGANSDITSLTGLTTPLAETEGGTGYGSYTTGDILYASSSTTLARLNDVATGNVLLSGGVGVAPSYGKVGLTTHVTGTLPIANGGTGQITASAAFNALSPITSVGDLIIGTGVNTASRLPIGANGYVLTSNGTTATWSTITGVVSSFSGGTTGLTPNTPSTGVVTLGGTLGTANGGTGLTSFTSGGAVYATSASVLTTGTLPVTAGGTGAATLTGYLVGNGTSAVTAVATIPNAGLTNSTITVGSTTISLGGTATTISGLTTLTLTQDPTAALQASTKQYVDNQVATVSNQTFHTASGYATTADLGTVTYSNGTGGVNATITNAGTQAALTIDGYTFTATDVTNATRVLVKDQSSGLQNGIYVVTNQGSGSTNWVLTRASDFNTVGTGPNFIETGAATFIQFGTLNGSTSWVMTTTGTITVGTTALTFTQTSSAGNILVTSPITKAGNTIGLSTVPINLGGTGQTTASAAFNALSPVTSTGDLIIGNGVNSATRLAIGTNGYILTSNGTTASWAAPPATGVTSFQTSLNGLTPSTSTTGAVTLAGTLGISSGGTGQITASAAFNALSPITSTGDIIIGNGTNSATRLPIGTNGYVLTSNGTTASWAASTGGVTSFQTSLSGLTPSTSSTGAITLAGTLGVTSGGTGTSTTFTQGSVHFTGASGVYSQNATKFFWDNTNNRLGINTASPQTQLTVVSNTQTTTPSGALPAGTDVYIVGANAANTRITQDAYGTGAYGAYTARQARGTAAAPTATQSGDFLAQFTGRGYGATGFGTASTGYFSLTAAENFTDTAQGTYGSIYVTATGGNSPVEGFRVGPAGQIGVGAGAIAYGTSGYALVSGGASASPSWSQISLTAGVTGTLPVGNGGTGITSYTTGDLLYASSSSALARLADVATGNVLLSGGVGVAPSWGKVDLTAAVTGTLPVANGGTGQASALTQYGVVYGSTTSAMATTAAGTTGQILTATTGGAPTWSSTIPSTAGVTSISFGSTGLTPSSGTTGAVTVAGTLVSANGGTGFSTYTTGDLIYSSATNTLSKLGVGSTGQVLTVSGGVPTWAAASGGATGGGTDQIFWNNGQTVNSSYSIPANINAGTFGPITIGASATVTIPSSSTWTVV